MSSVEDVLSVVESDKDSMDSDNVYYRNESDHVLMQYPELDVIEPDSECELVLELWKRNQFDGVYL